MSSLTPSRRTVLRTAAWSVPVVSVATAAPAFAASPGDTQPEYQSVEKTFVYDAKLDLGGTLITLGQVNVAVTALVPLVAPIGVELNPTETTSTVTIPGNLADTLKSTYLPGATQVDGTSESTSILSGALTGNVVSNLVIPMTPLPPAGQPLVTSAVGASAGGLTGISEGLVTITMGEPLSKLYGYDADGTATGGVYNSRLYKQAAGDYTLATFNVVA